MCKKIDGASYCGRVATVMVLKRQYVAFCEPAIRNARFFYCSVGLHFLRHNFSTIKKLGYLTEKEKIKWSSEGGKACGGLVICQLLPVLLHQASLHR